MKKHTVICILTTLLICAISVFTGCGGSDTDPEKPSLDLKILVAYFSATGTTERVAEQIKNHLGSDIFEIVPIAPYTTEDLNTTIPIREQVKKTATIPPVPVLSETWKI